MQPVEGVMDKFSDWIFMVIQRIQNHWIELKTVLKCNELNMSNLHWQTLLINLFYGEQFQRI